MKNIFRILMAVAVLFTASCAKEDISSSIVGGEANVTFTVDLPELGTRYGEGSKVDILRYNVYEYGTETPLTQLSGYKEAQAPGQSLYTITIPMLKGMKYDIVFWAEKQGTGYYTLAGKEITVNYDNAIANDESRDAFFGSVKKFDPTNPGNMTSVELRRPFAQLNAITTDCQLIKKSGITAMHKSALKVTSKLHNQFNIFSGEATGEVENVGFAINDIPAETKTIDDNTDMHLAMNYLLVNGEKALVDVKLLFVGKRGDAEYRFPVAQYSGIPVKRNYRTNIIGKLLTATTDFNVEIKPGFETEENTIFTAFKEGGEVTLTEDITIAEPLVVAAGVKAVLNLNRHNIINTTASEEFGEGEGIIAYGDLTINGTGTVQGTTMAVWARGNNGAKVTINGGTYKGCAEGFAFGGRSVIYASSGNVITINGGYFESLAADKVSYANKIEGVYAALNVADNNGSIIVKGGSFYKQNPAAPGTEPAAWNADHPNGFVAAGYKAVVADNKYYVLPEVVANAAEAANVTAVTESTADVATALATDNGEATMFMWNDVAYIAKYGEVVIASSADEATTARGIVEYATALTSATVAEGVEVVGNRTFRRCSELKTVALPNTLTEIGPAVFQSCSKLAKVTIPASVTTIGEGAFAECTSLTSINIPDGVTRIEDNTFNASGLESIEFHAGVTYFGAQAFRDCKQLKKVVINAPEFTIEANAFGVMAGALPGTVVIYVANSEMKAYLESTLAYKNQFTIVGPTSVSNADELKNAIIKGGKIELANDITVDKWIMFSEDLNIGNGTIITLPEINVNIDGKGHTLTINSIESAGNNDQLFQGATNLNIANLTIKYADGLTYGGLGMRSGVIKNVHFVGGGAAASSAAIFPGVGEIKVEDCVFDTNGVALYFDHECDNLTVNRCTFNQKAEKNVILLRGDVKFTDNIINSGRTVNIVSGSPVVTGNDFNDVRLKVYGAATATVANNIINNLKFDGTVHHSTFTGNTLSAAAQAALDAMNK